jgi:hypothetical protein
MLEACLKPFGNPTINNSNAYRNARLQIKDFRNLLRIVVDERKSLAQKVDAPWEKIGGLGQDKALAKKIIYCFNYQKGTVFPIFSNQHLRHFVNRVSDTAIFQTKNFSLGQEYEHYTLKLLKTKNNSLPTKAWNNLYFARFLYDNYPPPNTETPIEEKKPEVTDEQLDMQSFVRLLVTLQQKGKITGEQFREYRHSWTQQPVERQELANRLKKQLAVK